MDGEKKRRAGVPRDLAGRDAREAWMRVDQIKRPFARCDLQDVRGVVQIIRDRGAAYGAQTRIDRTGRMHDGDAMAALGECCGYVEHVLMQPAIADQPMD